MDIQMMTRFFMWSTILNAGLLVVFSLALLTANDFIYRMHSKFIPMPRETFNVVIYSFIGLYKVMIFVFNIIPWAALSIIG